MSDWKRAPRYSVNSDKKFNHYLNMDLVHLIEPQVSGGEVVGSTIHFSNGGVWHSSLKPEHFLPTNTQMQLELEENE